MYFLFSSCPPSWREFVHEFNTPAKDKVNLQLDKRMQEEMGKFDLAFINVGSSEKEVLKAEHVGKYCLGMMKFFGKVLLNGENH